MRTPAGMAHQLMELRRQNAELQRQVSEREAEIAQLKQAYRRTVARQEDALPVKRLFCDDCVQWMRDREKCGLGYRDVLFRVPASYADIHGPDSPNWGWFRVRKCREYAAVST